MKRNETLKFARIALLAGALTGAAAAFVSPGPYLNAFWGAALVTAVSVFLLLELWQWSGKTRWMAWLLAVAFLLRLLTGFALYTLLPAFGYDEPTQNAGYVFYDAAQRDRQAWELSQSHQVIEAATGAEFVTDQYGGLLAFSAAAYTIFSPDAHRPLLIVLFAVFAGAFGAAFIFLALRKRFGENTAKIAAWIFALYPQAIVLSASQMREPFLFGLTAIAFWAVTQWKSAPRKVTFAALLASLLVMACFSSRVAVPVAGVLAVWFWLEHYADALPAKWQKVTWIVLIGAALVFAAYGWKWVASTSVFDTRMTEYNSGRIQKAIEELGMELGMELRVPFIVGYGLTQPVLPAALTDPALPIWRVTSSLLAAGWYAIAPFLIYALIALWREKNPVNRRLLAWSTLACMVWVLISSARAGGDQWDNPRYRALFIPWLALIAAWGWDFARREHDGWLWRILGVEGIFLLFFISWYMSRYYNLLTRLPFNTMLVVIIILSLVVLVGGAVWDWSRERKKG